MLCHFFSILLMSEGQAILIFIPNHSPFPNDGIRYLEQEVKYSIPAGMRGKSMPILCCPVRETLSGTRNT